MPYKLSPSSMSTLKDCPRCFWLAINKKISPPAGIFPSLPSGMDAVLKKHFDACRKKGSIPEELKGTGARLVSNTDLQKVWKSDFKGTRWHFNTVLNKDTAQQEPKAADAKLFKDVDLLNIWRSNFKGIRWQDKKGNELHGAVDEILVKNGKLIVLDFKTRGFPCKDDTHKHYQDQMDIYNFLLRKNGYETEDYAYLLFFHPTAVTKTGDFAFERTLKKVEINVKNAEKIFTSAIKCLEGPMPKPGKDCEVCEFVRERT
ncbi:MAG: PD-(D/E)XK nuclease family protein [Candidatus Aenigmarchaeota archaeon]|nr:PD-(D/E)XK nuclease family protein [Candidatus Aenigmarchaeota archaeon]